jgi:ADP-ribose pyrophosphatase YjhB (NUDIX family)
MAIRNAAKAIILHNDKILVNRCITENNEVYFDLPGGGQNQFETMEDAGICVCVDLFTSVSRLNEKHHK